MVKAEKAEEITRKLKRMGEENQIEDEVEKADRMAGLGYKLNTKLFEKIDSRMVDPNKNFYKLEGENVQELEKLKIKKRSSKLSKRISKKDFKIDNKGKNKIQFIKRKKGESRSSRRSRNPRAVSYTHLTLPTICSV